MTRRWWLGLVVGVVVLGTAASAAADTLTASCESDGQTGQCHSSWYTAPVTVVWQADAPYNESSCDIDKAYVYSTDGIANVSCTVTWQDGPRTTQSYPLSIEVSNPTATATPSRPPDANGWYNHPVSISFAGSAFAGLAFCTPTQTYAGPDTAGASVTGSCTDNAGKTATTSLNLRYDATPPAVNVSAEAGDESVRLDWSVTTGLAPLTSLEVVRSPGLRGTEASVLAPTAGTGAYADTAVRNHVGYRYTVTAVDQAGNVTVHTVEVTPAARLLTPAPGARVNKPPRLSWTSVPKATYYNVQLFHGGKILSAWPTGADLQLGRTWRFDGHDHRLRPGRYRWYVWPGFGRRRADRYGAALGTGTFVVT